MKIQCQLCKKEFKSITNTHLKQHSVNIQQYLEQFPNAEIISEESKKKFSDNAKIQNSIRDYSTQGVKISATKKLKYASGEAVAWNKGLPMSDEQKQKLSQIKKEQYASGKIKHWALGHIMPEEVKKKISEKCKGYKFTEEQRQNLLNFLNSDKHPKGMLNKSHSNDTKQKISNSLHIKKDEIRKTMEEKGLWIPLDLVSDFELYKRAVCGITQKNVHLIPNYDPSIRGRCSLAEDNHQIDHILSITDGFKQGIAPEILGSIANLRFIPWQDNLSKWSDSHITAEELIELFGSL
jgi:hypothetical protein